MASVVDVPMLAQYSVSASNKEMRTLDLYGP